MQLTFPEKFITTLACLAAIFLTASITLACSNQTNSVLIASMGASAVILFAVPSSPLAHPWSFVGGQMLSALIGIGVARYIPDLALAASLAVGFSVLSMLLLRCLHPPGAATALAPILSSTSSATIPDFNFLYAPVGLNVLSMLAIALLINRLILHRDYPAKRLVSSVSPYQNSLPDNVLGITEADIEQATQGEHQFLDIGANDLCRILSRLQVLSVQKYLGTICCADIMQRDIICVEYATEVETAWLLMHQKHLKVLPVLDQKKHVVGIVTRYDFLKNLKLTAYENFQDKWLTFIKPSPEISTHKPECIGHIMTRKVKTLSANTHIAELVPLVVNEGHHHIPIVDDAGHFLGMVFQSRLLLALFNNQLEIASTSRQIIGQEAMKG